MGTLNKLTDRKVRNLKPDAAIPKKRFVSDGGGLYISMTKRGSKSWIFRYRIGSKQTDVGLGSFPAISLAEARNRAAKCREAKAHGKNVIEAMRPPVELSFKTVLERFMVDKCAENPSPIVLREWRRLETVVTKDIHSKDIGAIEPDDIINILKPIWTKTPVSAKKAQQRLERIFRYAKANRWRTGFNPAAWKENLEDALPRQDHRPKHHAAMRYEHLPKFMEWLRNQDRTTARTLELLVLTGCRTSEVLKADISEFNLDEALWTIPATRMKNRREHVVPLSGEALSLVRLAIGNRTSGLLYPGTKDGKPYSNMTLPKNLVSYGLQSDTATVHGFRSTFRDWAGDATDYSREVAEAALSHQIGSSVERTYRRGSALQKRRRLMEDWAEYCSK